MKEKIEKIKARIEEVGCVWGYGIGVEKYGSWGLVVYTPYKDIEEKLSSVFGEIYLGRDNEGFFFFWPVDEI